MPLVKLLKKMELLPIKESLEENTAFLHHPDCKEILPQSVEFYKVVGYVPPWIGYFVMMDGQLAGAGGFKGVPVDGRVEIAYGTFERLSHPAARFSTYTCSRIRFDKPSAWQQAHQQQAW